MRAFHPVRQVVDVLPQLEVGRSLVPRHPHLGASLVDLIQLGKERLAIAAVEPLFDPFKVSVEPSQRHVEAEAQQPWQEAEDSEDGSSEGGDRPGKAVHEGREPEREYPTEA